MFRKTGKPHQSQGLLIGEQETDGVDAQGNVHEWVEPIVQSSSHNSGNPFTAGMRQTQLVELPNLMTLAFLPQQIPPLKAFSVEKLGEKEKRLMTGWTK